MCFPVCLYFQVALSRPSPSTSFFTDIICQAAKVESVVAPGGPSRFRYFTALSPFILKPLPVPHTKP